MSFDASSADCFPPFWLPLLDSVTRRQWRDLTLESMAKDLTLPFEELHAHIPDKVSFLVLFARYIDGLTLETYHPDPALSLKDRLFDLLMRRFDYLTLYRSWIASLFHRGGCTPCEHKALGAQVIRSISLLCEKAGMNVTGLANQGKVLAVGGVYGYTVRQWFKDDSPDLDLTMATLDRGLSLLARWLPHDALT